MDIKYDHTPRNIERDNYNDFKINPGLIYKSQEDYENEG